MALDLKAIIKGQNEKARLTTSEAGSQYRLHMSTKEEVMEIHRKGTEDQVPKSREKKTRNSEMP